MSQLTIESKILNTICGDMMKLCAFGVFILISAVSAVCPQGWLRYDDSCYYFERIQKQSWHVAYNTCITLDANLVRIETAEEDNFLKAELRKIHPGDFEQYWTAGNDIDVEKDWVWAGSELYIDRIKDFTDWAWGEPNSINVNEDCLAFYPRKGYSWNDENCNSVLHFICEHSDPMNGNGVIG